jgi:hypothetical protein
MPRITISIPTSLKQSLQDPRVRKSINISRICQEALSRAIRRMLDLPLELTRFEGVLSRLKEEREAAGDRWFKEGCALCSAEATGRVLAGRVPAHPEASAAAGPEKVPKTPGKRKRLLPGKLSGGLCPHGSASLGGDRPEPVKEGVS